MNTWNEMTKTEKKIDAINASFKSVEDAVHERCAYRRKNYYDCIDDYSEYGPCWKADMAELDAARHCRDLKLEEVNGDGTHKEVARRYVLLDVNDNIVANELCCGQYGYYWYDTVNDRYVGTPKKLSTLTKKGYTPAIVINTYACKVNTVKLDMKVKNSEMTLISTEMNKLTEIPEYMSTGIPYADWQYETFFKSEAA